MPRTKAGALIRLTANDNLSPLDVALLEAWFDCWDVDEPVCFRRSDDAPNIIRLGGLTA